MKSILLPVYNNFVRKILFHYLENMMEAKLSNNFLSISFVSRLDEKWTKYR